jgi:hypothetical protein
MRVMSKHVLEMILSGGGHVRSVRREVRLVMWICGARRRRSGGGPGGGCACMPVGTYLYLHAMDANNHVAMPCLAQ